MHCGRGKSRGGGPREEGGKSKGGVQGGGGSPKGGGDGGSPGRETVGVPGAIGWDMRVKRWREGNQNSEGTYEKGRELIKMLIKQHKIAVKGTAM